MGNFVMRFNNYLREARLITKAVYYLYPEGNLRDSLLRTLNATSSNRILPS